MRVLEVSRLVLLVALVTSVAGCTVTQVGTASPQSAIPESPPPASDGPERPREIKIDDLRPCELITAEQRQEFKIDVPFSEESESAFQSQICEMISHSERVSIAFNVILKHDVARFGIGNPATIPRAVQVAGFPAFEVRLKESDPGDQGCSVNVGVSKGQVIRARFLEQGRKSRPLSYDEVCRRATRGAELAVGNLLNRR
ncbi:DUF3558 domain-containing protein [Allokutzneria sp. NRRL B-24872]|uniref:DUF3558 domain-containing protein n=1 Tax=Allokutzneria sp. NRRL B-24872 TaxID=1137961 RepID=UPI00143CEEC4|nr:DUF3558 domain-containing protein [Allokutzneria sp. NRRL B-24872]